MKTQGIYAAILLSSVLVTPAFAEQTNLLENFNGITLNEIKEIFQNKNNKPQITELSKQEMLATQGGLTPLWNGEVGTSGLTLNLGNGYLVTLPSFWPIYTAR